MLLETASLRGFTFPLLHDPDAKTIESYRILRQGERRIPHPTAVVIDAEGIIRYWRVDEDFKVRPTAAELLAALDALNGAPSKK